MTLYLNIISFPEIKKFSDNSIFSNIKPIQIKKLNPSRYKNERFPETQKSQFILFLLTSTYEESTTENLKEYLNGLGINTDYIIEKSNTKYLDIINEPNSFDSLIKKNHILKIITEKPKYIKQFIKQDPITGENCYIRKRPKYNPTIKNIYYRLNPIQLLFELIKEFENLNLNFKEIFKVDLKYDTNQYSTKNDRFSFGVEFNNILDKMENFTGEEFETEKEKLSQKYRKENSHIRSKLEESEIYYKKFLNDYNNLFEIFFNNISKDNKFLEDISFFFSTYIRIIFANNILRLFTLKYDSFNFKETFKNFILTIGGSNFSNKTSNDFERVISIWLKEKQIDSKKFKNFQNLCQMYSQLSDFNIYKIQPNSKLIF